MKHRRIQKAVSQKDEKINFEFRKRTRAYLDEYYGTVRESDFRHDHWKDEVEISGTIFFDAIVPEKARFF